MQRPTMLYLAAAGIAVMQWAGFACAKPAGANPLRLEAKIPLGKVSGRIDHMTIDLPRRRLFVAEFGNGRISIVDLGTQKVVQRITGLKEPQGVAYVAANDMLYVASGGDGSLRNFRGPDYLPAGRLNLGEDADNIRVDSANHRLLVGYGNGAIGVVDFASGKKAAAFALKGHPESFQLDTESGKIFVNVPGARSISVLDGNSGRELTRWLMPFKANFAMALDRKRQRVLTVFRQPAKLVAFAERTGARVGETDVCGDADDVFIDTKRDRIYISCGEGSIDVLNAADTQYKKLARIRSVAGARTALFVPDMDRLLLAVRARPGEPASIWVYRTVP
ncbi:MAG: YncE family protein [Acidobacteriota bacterium]